MAVVEPIGAALQELRAELEESWIVTIPRDRVWEAKIAEGQPVLRVLIGDRWWELRLKGFRSGGQRAAYEKIASGAAAGELFFHRVPTDDAQLGNGSGRYSSTRFEIRCRLVAWLPREQMEDAKRPQDALLASQPDPGVPDPEQTDIRSLREAIRANRVSFPSQVPTFAKHDRPDLQRKLAQLYFVLGWNTRDAGRRYGLSGSRVRQILDTWKRRAVKTGYIQYIPPPGTMNQQSLPTNVTAAPDLVLQFVQAPFPGPTGSLQNHERGLQAQ